MVVVYVLGEQERVYLCFLYRVGWKDVRFNRTRLLNVTCFSYYYLTAAHTCESMWFRFDVDVVVVVVVLKESFSTSRQFYATAIIVCLLLLPFICLLVLSRYCFC